MVDVLIVVGWTVVAVALVVLFVLVMGAVSGSGASMVDEDAALHEQHKAIEEAAA